jgi:hypothetical protein
MAGDVRTTLSHLLLTRDIAQLQAGMWWQSLTHAEACYQQFNMLFAHSSQVLEARNGGIAAE